MDIKSFVDETLTQILAGIRAAQSKQGGSDIAADGYLPSQANLINGARSGFFTHVEFDISVIAEKTEGGGSVRVADLETSNGNRETSGNASRVKFSVHVRLPKGGNNLDTGANY